MTKILNLTSEVLCLDFSYDGKQVEVMNIRRSEIEKIWEIRNIWDHIDTEELIVIIPKLSEVASRCCDISYLGVLVATCYSGFAGICRDHESFSYKCAEIIGSYCKRERLLSFVFIKHADIYILHE